MSKFKLNFHDSTINNISINPVLRTVIFQLRYLTDNMVEDKESGTLKGVYCSAILTLKDYQRIDFDIKGDKNKEIILTSEVLAGNNVQEGLVGLKIYTTSDSHIQIYFNDYTFEEILD